MTEQDEQPPSGQTARPLRVAFVPGVTPGKWARTWQQRCPTVPLELLPVDDDDQLAVLDEDRADLCLLRLPVDRADLSVIPLYDEVPVAVVGREHPVAVFDEVDVADLADEHLLQDPDTVPEWRDVATEVREGTRLDVPADLPTATAVEVVAAGTGFLILPKSVARLHNRKDVAHCPVTGVAGSQVGLAWRTAAKDDRVETFIGIVRGRTARSSRGPAGAPGEPTEPDQKTKGKQQGRTPPPSGADRARRGAGSNRTGSGRSGSGRSGSGRSGSGRSGSGRSGSARRGRGR